MYIYDDHGFAFFHQWKCGGTSVYKPLRDRIGHASVHLGDDGAVPPEKKIDVWYGKKLSVHSPLDLFLRVMCSNGIDASELTIFTNVRHPFPRMVSGWAWSIQHGHTKLGFNAWFDFIFPDYRWQSEYLGLDRGIPYNLHVVRLEEADTFWPPTFNKYFGFTMEFPCLNTTDHLAPENVLTRTQMEMILEKEQLLLSQYYRSQPWLDTE